ncbi:hypothetical protein N0V82_010125 [Gnomoniopsis sp. IMI 355080]|nr:hypothetical protein N0V82_010125 [Gnomoniopsis sp. IMI 355080]
MSELSSLKIYNATLAKPEDWDKWDHEFKLQVEAHNLGRHVFENRPLLRSSTMPDISKKKYTKRADRNARSQTLDNEDENDDNLQEKPNGEMWTTSDLTDAGEKLFNKDFMWYQQIEKVHATEHSSVEKLTKWILQTVSPDYKYTCCPFCSNIRT